MNIVYKNNKYINEYNETKTTNKSANKGYNTNQQEKSQHKLTKNNMTEHKPTLLNK